MTDWTRRQVSIGAVMAGFALGSPVVQGRPKARVVVIGGGIGGATTAKYLLASVKGLDVTLVEPKLRYTTKLFGNLYLAGMRSLASLTHGYETLATRGVKVIHDSAKAIRPAARQVELVGGGSLPYDRLIVAPGIAFRRSAIPGFDEAAAGAMPHAWTAGPQLQTLRAQLEAIESGGVFVIGAPPAPYHCPLGPYERASLAAYFFKQFKPRAKVLILDAKDTFAARELFEEGWSRHFPGMIEYLPASTTGGIKAVDVKARAIRTGGGTIHADVASLVPAQMAGDIAQSCGLTDVSGWCPVDPVTFESQREPSIHVVGDATIAGGMSKSAFAANSQAKACAFAIAAEFSGADRAPPLLFDAGYTYLAGDDAISEARSFRVVEGRITTTDAFLSRTAESKERRRKTAQEAGGWYNAFTQDVFG